MARPLADGQRISRHSTLADCARRRPVAYWPNPRAIAGSRPEVGPIAAAGSVAAKNSVRRSQLRRSPGGERTEEAGVSGNLRALPVESDRSSRADTAAP